MSTPVGFIGVGHMGGAMARRLLAAGHALVVHDRDSATAAALRPLGARLAPSPRAVADDAAVVFMCLPSIDAMRQVTNGPEGVAAGRALRVLVETSTVGPAAVRELARRMEARDIAVVDAPVSGGPRGAEAGTLSVMHAGRPEAVARVLPLLEALAGRRFDVGSEAGLAQVCKLVNNAISAAGMVAACEATVLGAKAGLDPATMLDAINAGSGRNAATIDKFPKSILTGTFDFGGPMGLMLKDLSLFIEEARRLGVPGVMAPAALAAWEEAVRRTGGDADYTMLIRHLEADAGVEVRTRSSSGSRAASGEA